MHSLRVQNKNVIVAVTEPEPVPEPAPEPVPEAVPVPILEPLAELVPEQMVEAQELPSAHSLEVAREPSLQDTSTASAEEDQLPIPEGQAPPEDEPEQAPVAQVPRGAARLDVACVGSASAVYGRLRTVHHGGAGRTRRLQPKSCGQLLRRAPAVVAQRQHKQLDPQQLLADFIIAKNIPSNTSVAHFS
ncbi:cytadherence high molecular weight protein 1-like isoform X1 [Dermacentor albipictus]|uniref:cytadherence high molecular weight protein 1-like isoform X1 n=2 Tax=Dermacentor albipictus TaxID=60249 RepID=UPI0038FCBD64